MVPLPTSSGGGGVALQTWHTGAAPLPTQTAQTEVRFALSLHPPSSPTMRGARDCLAAAPRWAPCLSSACTLPAISQLFRSPESPEAPCPSSCTSDPIYGFSHLGGPCYRAVHLFLASSLSSLRWPLSFLFLQPRVPLSLSKPLRLEGCGSKFAVPSRPHRKDLVLCSCSLAPLL